MTFSDACYKLAVWRANPAELIQRSIHSNEPRSFGEQKHRPHEVVLFFGRIWLRTVTMYCLRRAYQETGYIPVGYGYYTVALKKQDEVLKIYEFSMRCTDSERQQLVASLQHRLKLANAYLEDFMTPTTVSIQAHPVYGLQCVVLHQPYVLGVPLVKKPYSKYLHHQQQKNFAVLLSKAHTLFNETGYMLDVNGHNLIATDKTVKIVDTILMGKVDVNMRQITVRILKRETDYLRMKGFTI